MVKQAIQIISTYVRDNLPAALESLSSPIEVAQILDPFTDDKIELVDFPGVIVTMGMFKSPQAEFKVFEKADVLVPVVVEFVTKDPDTAQARGHVSDAVRAILHVLNTALVDQAAVDDARLIEVFDAEFDFVLTESECLGGAVHFIAQMRDYTP